MRKQRLWADLALLSVAFIWGVAFVVQRIAAAEIQVYVFNGTRFLVGAVVILPFAYFRLARLRRKRELDPVSSKLMNINNIPGILLAGLLLASGSAFQQTGLIYTTASNAGFITGLYVVLIPLFLTFGWSRRDARRLPRPMVWIAAVLSAFGLFLLTTGGQMQINRGDLLMLISAIFWAFHVILIDWMVQQMNVMAFAAGQYLVCGLASLGLGIFLEPDALKSIYMNWWMFAYTGIISVGLGYTLQAVGQRVAPPSDTAIILSMEAVFAAVSGWLFLGEKLAPIQLMGCGIILIGMLLAQFNIILGKSHTLLRAEE